MKRRHKALLLGVMGTLVVLGLSAGPWKLAVLGVEALAMTPSVVQQRADHDHYWDVQTLEVRLQVRFGYEVAYVPGLLDESHVYGRTMWWPKRLIEIDESLSWSERWRVLTHEAGHVLQPQRLSTQEKEVFAESVSALLAKDGLREHARYMAEVKAAIPLTLLIYWPEIYQAAEVLARD